jgi:hypothetical protein
VSLWSGAPVHTLRGAVRVGNPAAGHAAIRFDLPRFAKFEGNCLVAFA